MKQDDGVDPNMKLMWWCLKLGCDVGAVICATLSIGPEAALIYLVCKFVENYNIDYAYNKGYPFGLLVDNTPGPIDFVGTKSEDQWNKYIEQQHQYEAEEKECPLQLEDMPGPIVIEENQNLYIIESCPSKYEPISVPVGSDQSEYITYSISTYGRVSTPY